MNQIRTRPIQVAAPDALLEPVVLEALLGQITSLAVQPFQTNGYSGALLQLVEVQLSSGRRQRLIHKRMRLAEDWTAYRTGDTLGRQAALLGEPRLHEVWDMLDCPYQAYAFVDGEVGLLMDDLSPWLLPDVDEPLGIEQEDQLLSALARLHARYWQSDVLELDWLARPAQLLRVLGPDAPGLETGRPIEPLFELVRNGWEAALARVPARTARWLVLPAETAVQQLGTGLPVTLLHGDAKVANFALLPTGVAAIDWSWVGAGPCTLDLGWYLAVNAGRLSQPKDTVIGRYRALLEQALGITLPDELWSRLLAFGVLGAARMLLWEKARGLDAGSPQAADEWAWWLRALDLALPR